MTKLTLNDIATVVNAPTTINTNNELIETAIENTLSRDGTAPNAMNADFDMNGNSILNLPYPQSPLEPVRLIDIGGYLFLGNGGGGDTAYDIVFQMEGVSTASEIIGRFGAVRAYTIPANCAGAYAEADSAATASTVFLLKKNGTQFGTMTWGIGETVATIVSDETAFAIDDLLTWVAPGTADATLSGIGVTIPATLT